MTTAGMGPFTHLLVVEGTSDQHTVFHLCRTHRPGFEAVFAFHDAKGFQGVLNAVIGFVNQENMAAVGFVVDADAEPDAHWRQVIEEIAAANNEIRLPQSPDPDGTIIPEDPAIGSPRIGIWVMPDNASTGELEDFVRQMIPDNDQVWPRAQDYINDIPSDARRFDDESISKNEVHAWLAARRRPGLIGLAVRYGDLNVDADLAKAFLRWLSRLFA